MENLEERRGEQKENPAWVENTQHSPLPHKGKREHSSPQTLGKEEWLPERDMPYTTKNILLSLFLNIPGF